MNIRLSRQRNDATALLFSAFISLLCMFFMVGCGTSRESANSYTQTVTAVDENGAARTLKLISTAQLSYSVSNEGQYGSFEDLTKAALLDNRFAGQTPEVGGYVYTIKLSPGLGGAASTYVVYADPKTPASGIQTNGRHLFMDSTSDVIHANKSQQASARDPAFQ